MLKRFCTIEDYGLRWRGGKSRHKERDESQHLFSKSPRNPARVWRSSYIIMSTNNHNEPLLSFVSHVLFLISSQSNVRRFANTIEFSRFNKGLLIKLPYCMYSDIWRRPERKSNMKNPQMKKPQQHNVIYCKYWSVLCLVQQFSRGKMSCFVFSRKRRMGPLNVEMAPYYRGTECIRVTAVVLTQAPED